MDFLWRIELLGWLRIVGGDRVITQFRSKNIAALLAYLAYHRQGTHPRERLIELLWPECEPKVGRNNLRVALAHLRRMLEPPGVPAGAVIVPDLDAVRLNFAVIRTDVEEFEAAVEAANRASNDAEGARRLAEAAVLYQGELLPGFHQQWVLAERERFAEAYFQALRRLITLRERAGDLPDALQWARRAVAADPFREEAHHELIRLLTAAGETDAVHQQYSELERMLEQLGSRPAWEIRSLIDGLPRAGRGQRAGGRVDSASPAADAPPAPAEASSPQTAHCRSFPGSRLPFYLTRFFGREEEIVQLEEWLAPVSCSAPSADRAETSSRFRLVTLVGAAGIGKTRLAVAVAQRVRPAYQQAVWFASFVGLSDPRHMPDRVLEALPISRSPNLEPLDQIAAFLCSLSTPDQPSYLAGCCLLLLDNLEHLLPEAGVFVADLLQRVSTLALLATSQERLGLPGEQELQVRPLPAPEEGSVPEELLLSPSVQLFVDRAQAARPEFQVTSRNALAISRLCAALEGLPLALELAAARVQVLSPGQMLSRLDRRFELLNSHRQAADVRHRSLQAALDWSYSLLSEERRRFLARLSVFRGGWTLEAAEAICAAHGRSRDARDGTAAIDLLDQLQACSLITCEEVSAGGSTEMRFRMLETVREYASHQLGPEERAQIERRHAAYYLDLVESGEAALRRPQERYWLRRIAIEHDNVRAALDWSLRSDPAQTGLRLAAAVSPFWSHEGYVLEARQRLELLLAATPTERTAWRAKALVRTGEMWRVAGDWPRGAAQLRESLALYQELQDDSGIAAALLFLGQIADGQGDAEQAVAHYEDSLALSRAAGDQKLIPRVLWALGNLHRGRCRFSEATAFFEESLALCRELGDTGGVTVSLWYLGNLEKGRGEYERARELYEEGRELAREMDDEVRMGLFPGGLAHVALGLGQFEVAAAHFAETLEIHRRTGSKEGVAWVLLGLGQLACARGDPSLARAKLSEALALFREVGHVSGIATCLAELGETASAEGDLEAARSLICDSLAIRLKLGAKGLIPRGLAVMASIAAAQGSLELAARLLGAAANLRDHLNVQPSLPERQKLEAQIAGLRLALGEAAYTVAWESGRGMDLEQALLLAFHPTPAPAR
jgi:predicted ATPase/DNA-binding SARP family transcriptional activator